MLDERKAAVLQAVVKASRTAQPVGSGHVSEAPDVEVSSATVRNDMAVLETEGYLHQPHTSAGQVPTEDTAISSTTWSTPRPRWCPRAAEWRVFFDTAHGELEAMLGQTSDLLSQLTDWRGGGHRPLGRDGHGARSSSWASPIRWCCACSCCRAARSKSTPSSCQDGDRGAAQRS